MSSRASVLRRTAVAAVASAGAHSGAVARHATAAAGSAAAAPAASSSAAAAAAAAAASVAARRAVTTTAVPTAAAAASAAAAAAAAAGGSATPTLPSLPYGYGDLSPAISEEIMTLHHSKHHATYIANFIAAQEKYAAAVAAGDVAGQMAQLQALKFNGGGHVNHTLFWENMCPPSQYRAPTGDLADRINSQWGSLEAFQEEMSAKSAAVQGSGWGWLAYSAATDKLVIATTANQDTLASTHAGLVPLLGIDVWEHAYYVDYKNVRPAYLKAFWTVANWECAEGRLAGAKAN